ncbi:MAG: protein-L-isoaspartate(D-aspartate) O-methyltransferase [Thermoguttaceae bacterium]
METAWRPRLAIPILISLFAAVLVVVVIGWSFAVMPLRMAASPSAGLDQPPAPLTGAKPSAETTENPRHVEARRRMVEEQLRGRDITDAAVLAAMGRIPRHRFLPKNLQDLAYDDMPAPIGQGQTISQPYIVALMTQAVRPKPESRALDIGTGSGYQAAVLAELCKEVYSIEIVKPLAESARERLAALGYKNVSVRVGDGYRGWPEKAPFDIIIVAAAPDHVPQPLVEQLAAGGRLVIPVGNFSQELLVIEKLKDGSTRRKSIAPVRFVPMLGEAEKANTPNPK